MRKDMKRISALSLAWLFALALVPHPSVAQNTDDPFSDPTPVATKVKPKREKVVVHLPTLDLCFRWMEMNKGLVQIQQQVSRTKIEIDSLDAASPKKVSAKLETRLNELTTTYTTTKRILDRIPLDSTFDLERWQQFKQQLRQNRMAEAERLAIEDALANENNQLRAENKKLRADIERLKNGR
jgi:hypothetical protein